MRAIWSIRYVHFPIAYFKSANIDKYLTMLHCCCPCHRQSAFSDQWSVIGDQQYDLLYKFITFEIGLNIWKIADKSAADLTRIWQTDDNNSGDCHRHGVCLVSVSPTVYGQVTAQLGWTARRVRTSAILIYRLLTSLRRFL